MAHKVMTVKEMMDNHVHYGQFYAQTTISNSIQGMTDSLCNTLYKDILTQMFCEGIKLDPPSVKEEIDSIRDTLRSFVSTLLKYDFNLMGVPEGFYKKLLGDSCELFSKNKLLYTRPCEFFVFNDEKDRSKKLFSIEFND